MVSTWTVEDFKAAISEDVGSSSISDINLKVLLLHYTFKLSTKKKRKRAHLSSGNIVMDSKNTLYDKSFKIVLVRMLISWMMY